jgi:hypothetical protein
MKNLFNATAITVMTIALFSSCSPKHRYDRLIRKYPYLSLTDTVIVRDTLIKEVRVPVPEYRDSFIIQHDTVIETEKLIITRKGDFFGITVKPDTITYRDTIPYEVKVAGKIVNREIINWWYIASAFIIGMVLALYLRK